VNALFTLILACLIVFIPRTGMAHKEADRCTCYPAKAVYAVYKVDDRLYKVAKTVRI